uniref:Uncharacterized protein n=1 Tax=Arundo donax TaxID=35708 RepID=A0A0A9ADQ3_ARUDO
MVKKLQRWLQCHCHLRSQETIFHQDMNLLSQMIFKRPKGLIIIYHVEVIYLKPKRRG